MDTEERKTIDTPKKSGRPVFFRRWDVWVVAALLLCGGVLLAVGLARPPGAVARVTVAGQAAAPAQTIPLDKDGLYHIEGRLPVTLEVRDGAIRFINSVCPDHDCERFRWLRREGARALCMPAGVEVWIEEAA